jgi:preprotein translocase subunit YajC
MNVLALTLLQAAPRSQMIGPAITLVSFGLIMYFLIIRPQRKIQMQHRAMVDSAKKGDEVMTEGGLIGTIVHIADDRVTLKSADARVIISKMKIARVFSPTAPES